MNRRSLGAKAGMAFLYTEVQRGGFWMKNTLIPLDIAFADARGKILRILTMQPCRRDPCRIYYPNVAYRTALEVNAGSFRRWGVKAGDVSSFERADGQLQHVRPVAVVGRVEALSRPQEHVRVELRVEDPPRRRAARRGSPVGARESRSRRGRAGRGPRAGAGAESPPGTRTPAGSGSARPRTRATRARCASGSPACQRSPSSAVEAR